MPLQERVSKEFHQAVQGDLNELMLGDRLGGGSSREIFVNRMNPRQVVKVETDGFQNITEHLVWAALCDTPWAPWMARCFWISANGRVLIQERTYLPKRAPKLPELVPAFFADARECNMGVVRGRWVFHDYGHTNLLRLGAQNSRWIPLSETHMVAPVTVEMKERTLP